MQQNSEPFLDGWKSLSYLHNMQGCNANKKGVGKHPKNFHFKTASNSF